MSYILQQFKKSKTITLGRGQDCDVVFKSNSVDILHCTIEELYEDKYLIRDNQSEHGLFINGKRIVNTEVISKTDVIYIGRYRFSIEAGPENISNEIAIRIDNIKQEFNKIVKLHTTSLEILKQSLVAILGPSGCGKSVLLKALSGDTPPKSGQIYVFGLDLNENYEYLKTQIGYVPQDDIVHGDLTVLESLYYAAKLRLSHLNKFEIEKKIDQILTILRITEIKHNKIKKISGGQRKRVCIGVELLTEPKILFLDEPTSPLDPQTVYDFLETLRSLTLSGTTVVMVTHKPEELHYMDKAIFMAEGGHVVYYDNTDSFLDYFQVDDAVQVYPNLVGNNSDKWIKKFKMPTCVSPVEEKKNPGALGYQKTDYISQFYWLTRRYLNIKFNDKVNFALHIAQAPFIAMLLCMIFENFSSSVPFFISVSSIWFGTNNAAREIVSEEKIFKRERMYNQGIFPYLLSKLTVLSTLSFIQSILFTLILFYHFKDSLNAMNDPMNTCLWMFYLSIAATMLGLVLSASVNTTEKVMTIIPLALLPQIMLAGIVVPIKSIFVELLSYLTFSRWGTEGAAIIQKTVAVPNYQPKEGTLYIDKVTQQLSKPIIEKTEKDTIADAVVKISENYDSSYKTTFSELYSTLNLDFLAILFITSILFITLFLAIKQKDSMKIY
jgi:ABC-type multidrug transport system ATPase subunit